MSKVIDFTAYLKKRAGEMPEPDINLLYRLLHETSLWMETEEGSDFWAENIYISNTIELCNLMIQMQGEPKEDVLTAYLVQVRFLVDFLCGGGFGADCHKEIASDIMEMFQKAFPSSKATHVTCFEHKPNTVAETPKKKTLSAAVLEAMKTKRWSVNELAKKLDTSGRTIRINIDYLRKKGHKIVTSPVEHTFWFEEGCAPSVDPVGGGDGRWKCWA